MNMIGPAYENFLKGFDLSFVFGNSISWRNGLRCTGTFLGVLEYLGTLARRAGSQLLV